MGCANLARVTGALRIGLLGLQTTHAFADPRSLNRLADVEFGIVEADDDRASRFLDEWPAAARFGSVAEMREWGPDGLIVTERPARVAPTVAEAAGMGRAVFINKPAAITREQVELLHSVIVDSPAAVFSASVLRAVVPPEAPRPHATDIRIRIEHDLGWWRDAPSRWQDDPTSGGGIVAALGLHALELAAIVKGDDFVVMSASARTCHSQGLRADDAELRLRWPDGSTAVVELVGAAVPERYRVWCDGLQVIDLPVPGSDPLGYVRTAAGFLEAIETGVPPVEWNHTRRILTALASAMVLASGV